MNVGLFRILKFVVIVLFLIHFLACFYLWMAKQSVHNWIDEKTSALTADGEDMDEPYKAYVVSVYFIVQTMTTVGYGDVGPASTPERIFVIALMLGGVFVFSMTTGMLASVLTSADEVSATESMLKSQLYRVSETFDLKPELHAKL